MNEIVKQLKQFDDKEQLKFLLSNPAFFVGEPLLFILCISIDSQDKLSYQKYLKIMNDIALKKSNIALLKATEMAMSDVAQLEI